MPRCEVCGNDYDRAFEVVIAGHRHVFDSFECAIHAVAPRCTHCQCTIIGQGVDHEGDIYCCENCVRHAGRKEKAARAK